MTRFPFLLLPRLPVGRNTKKDEITLHLPHSTYYRDRDTEYDLCQDFPATVARNVALRKKDLSKISADQIAYREQKDQPGGKKTMKSYLWSLELAAYDAQHQG